MARGWYLLPRSGLLFHGTIPPGVEEVDPSGADGGPAAAVRPGPRAGLKAWRGYVVELAQPFAEQLGEDIGIEDQVARLNKDDLVAVADALEQAAQGEESGTPVWPEVTGLDLGPDPEKVPSAPGEGGQVDTGDGTG